MKNQYFGDVNDYQKYSILRCLAQDGGPTLFVAWWLTPNDDRTDGRRTEYLRRPKEWESHDPPLYRRLREWLDSDVRDVSVFERAGMIENAGYFSELVPSDALVRKAYMGSLTAACAGYDLLFLDPDNGLEVKSVPYGRPSSSKYVYWREARSLYERGHSLIIYQHFPRIDRKAFVRAVSERLRTELGSASVFALETGSVVFLVADQPNHREQILKGVCSIAGSWDGKILLHEVEDGQTSR